MSGVPQTNCVPIFDDAGKVSDGLPDSVTTNDKVCTRQGLANIGLRLGKKGSPAYEHFKSAMGYRGGVVARCDLVKYTACIRGKCAVKKTVNCRDVCKVTGFATHPKNHPMFKVPRVEKCLKPIMHRDKRQNKGWQKPVPGKVTSIWSNRGAKFSHGGSSSKYHFELL